MQTIWVLVDYGDYKHKKILCIWTTKPNKEKLQEFFKDQIKWKLNDRDMNDLIKHGRSSEYFQLTETRTNKLISL